VAVAQENRHAKEGTAVADRNICGSAVPAERQPETLPNHRMHPDAVIGTLAVMHSFNSQLEASVDTALAAADQQGKVFCRNDLINATDLENRTFLRAMDGMKAGALVAEAGFIRRGRGNGRGPAVELFRATPKLHAFVNGYNDLYLAALTWHTKISEEEILTRSTGMLGEVYLLPRSIDMAAAVTAVSERIEISEAHAYYLMLTGFAHTYRAARPVRTAIWQKVKDRSARHRG